MFVFAEDRNDAKALEELISALCPQAKGRVERRTRPLILAKGAQRDALRRRAAKLAATLQVEAARGKPAACVFVHEDADAHPPADAQRVKVLTDAARQQGLRICPVVPAWEMESWWFLFPSAVAAAFPTWKQLPQSAGRDVDRLKDAKEALKRATGRRGERRYSEADAPRIAAEVRRLGEAQRTVQRNRCNQEQNRSPEGHTLTFC